MKPSSSKKRRADGFSLLEILAALTLVGILLTSSFPVLRGVIHRFSVMGAREEVAGLFARARAGAITHGGSIVRLQRSPPVVELVAGGKIVERIHLGRTYRTALSLSRGREEAVLRYDALGLGRITSQTLLFTRGAAEGRLFISSYGRVRRQ